MLADYAGTVLLVSHDRDFLDRVVTSVVMAEGDGRWTEYAGGYTDMLAQRGRGVAPPKPVKREVAPKPATSPGPDRRPRLSFHEQHALKMLPGQIEALQAEIARLQARLADPGLYGRDRAAFDRATAALSAAESKLAAAEDEWLTLELRREELEG
jgi:ATP-binding cassette subfamily F protein uup